MYREDKTTQAAVRILRANGGSLDYVMLLKLLYLADKAMLLTWGKPITYDTWRALQFGPVLMRTYELLRSGIPGQWSESIETRGHDLTAVSDPGIDSLSPSELDAIDRILLARPDGSPPDLPPRNANGLDNEVEVAHAIAIEIVTLCQMIANDPTAGGRAEAIQAMRELKAAQWFEVGRRLGISLDEVRMQVRVVCASSFSPIALWNWLGARWHAYVIRESRVSESDEPPVRIVSSDYGAHTCWEDVGDASNDIRFEDVLKVAGLPLDDVADIVANVEYQDCFEALLQGAR